LHGEKETGRIKANDKKLNKISASHCGIDEDIVSLIT
jgi:hypothetical protein